jgi:serine/threonine-protein kinase
MAPERVRNDPDADHRSDIWSVGVVLHELVTGRAIFDADSITETCARIVSDEPVALEQNDAVLPPSLRAIIGRCLERDPARRFQSVEELAAALAPLATMHERFRGRSTGAFSRRLVEQELAQRQGPASERLAVAAAAPGTWQHAAAGLRAWGFRLWASGLPRAVGLGAASVMLLGVGVWLAGVRWTAPPPSAAPLRAEPAARKSEAKQESIVESVLPLETSGTSASSSQLAAPSGVAVPSPTPLAPASAAGRAASTAADDRAPAGRRRLEPRARSASNRGARRERASSAVPSTGEAEPSGSGRSRVRLVGSPSSRDARAKGEAKKERPKKARPLPPWLQPNPSKAPSRER